MLRRTLWLFFLSGLLACGDAPKPRGVDTGSTPNAAAPPLAQTGLAPRPAPDFAVFGYYPWWLTDLWQTFDPKLIDELIFFNLTVDAQGQLANTNGWPEQWQTMISRLRAGGSRVVPSFAILDTQTFITVFSSTRITATLRTNILRAMRTADADGVHINFEVFDAIPPAAKRNFTQFLADLKQAMHPNQILSAFALALDTNDAYDEAGMAQHVDYLAVQGYDMHWVGGDVAGPVAGLRGWGTLNWQHILNRYDAAGVPRRKILMTVPYYGYEWPTVSGEIGARTRGQGQPITFNLIDAARLPYIPISAQSRIREHGQQRDPESGSPYYAFRGPEGWVQGWYEDAISLRAKYRFIKDQGLGGVVVFPFGYDGGVLDPVLREAFR